MVGSLMAGIGKLPLLLVRNIRALALLIVAGVLFAGWWQTSHPHVERTPLPTPQPPLVLEGRAIRRPAWCPAGGRWQLAQSPNGSNAPTCYGDGYIVYAGLYRRADGCTAYAPQGADVPIEASGLQFARDGQIDLGYYTVCK